VFKKVWNFIKPIVKIVAIAVAVYFTAGLALSAFAPALAASLPGFAAAGVAGAGPLTTLASSIGLGGGLTAGAAAANSAAAAAALGTAGGVAADAGVMAAGTAGGAATAASGAALSDAVGAGLAQGTTAALASTAAPTIAAGAGATAAAAGGMTLTDKLLLASLGTQAISGLTSPTPKDLNTLNKTFFGAYYGVNADGSKAEMSSAPAAAAGSSKPAVPAQTQVPGVSIPGQVTSPTSVVGSTPTAQTSQQAAQQQSLIPQVPYSGQALPGQTPDFAVQGETPSIKPQLIPS